MCNIVLFSLASMQGCAACVVCVSSWNKIGHYSPRFRSTGVSNHAGEKNSNHESTNLWINEFEERHRMSLWTLQSPPCF